MTFKKLPVYIYTYKLIYIYIHSTAIITPSKDIAFFEFTRLFVLMFNHNANDIAGCPVFSANLYMLNINTTLCIYIYFTMYTLFADNIKYYSVLSNKCR